MTAPPEPVGAAAPLDEYLAQAGRAAVEACTACGACVDVCPVVRGVDATAGEAMTADVVAFLAGGSPMPEATAAWAGSCNGCGECIAECAPGVNPRRMLFLANAMAAAQGGATPQLFRKMARAIRLMAAMQLVPDDLARLMRPPRARPAPIVFYTSCNAVRTPHILFNAMTILDALDIDYEVVGGPGACCGVIHARWEGDAAAGGRVAEGTLGRFADFEPETVLTWCSSCQLFLGETIAGYGADSFGLEHVTTFLAGRLDELRRRFVRPIERRVVLHAHVGLGEIGRSVGAMLDAVPGLDLVETVWESGYTCGGAGCDKAPELRAREHAEVVERTRLAGADVLATLYHGCHSAFLGAEADGGFRVINFTDLLVEALGGVPRDDVYKRFSLMDDWRMVVEEGEPLLRANGIEVDAAWLEATLPDLFARAEFAGGLDCFAAPR